MALAAAAAARGWPVTLLLGPTCLADDSSGPVHRFRTARDLQALLGEHWPAHDLLIMAAAVADYRPAGARRGKISRSAGAWTLTLEPTPDLVAEAAAAARPDQRIVGFALEPSDRLPDRAREKLADKRLWAIVANPLKTMDAGEIDGTLILADGRALAPPDRPCSKERFAEWLLETLDRELSG